MNPQANIHWSVARDLRYRIRFVEGRGYYVATTNDGEECVCYWHGREAKTAQMWLKKMAEWEAVAGGAA